MATSAAAAVWAVALQHGSMIMPVSRNAVDAELPDWSNGKHAETGLIEPYTCACNNGTEPCSSGQGCFWFSQGCNIGCSVCTGNGTRLPNLDQCPHERKGPPSELPGALLPKYRTTNLLAEPGSIADIWKYNPWRAPGTAPVFDSCGMAGGNYYEVFNAGAYKTTKFAKQGDLGTKVLKPRPTGTVWPRGSVQKTRWELTAAHGGGYQYRLCPANETLNEACFSKNPIAFAKNEDGGYSHTVITSSTPYQVINATMVEEGGGVGWMMHPMGYDSTAPCDWNPGAFGEHCTWHCPRCGAPWWAADGACPDSKCSHHPELPNISSHYGDNYPHEAPRGNTIEDSVMVPQDVAPGDYVLQWRWDCEATSQIWTSCSDITIS